MYSIQEIKNNIPILEELPIGVLITDIDGHIEYVNNELIKMNGYSREELLGKKPNVLKSGEHNLDFYRVMWDTILKGEEYTGEIKNIKKDGTTFWQKVTIKPYKKNGIITNFIAYISDITEIRYADMLYKAMIHNSYDSHLIWNKNRVCTNVYPGKNSEYPQFYKKLLNNSLGSIKCPDIGGWDDVFIEEHNSLFDAVDKNDKKTYTSIVKLSIDNIDITLEILMQRFNSNKYYEVIRNITDFSRNREALMDLEKTLANLANTDYQIRSFINGENSRKFIGRDK